MNMPGSFPRLKGFRFPREIVAYAVWAYYRFALSTADVEDLLAERGVIVSRETVRIWANRFGRHFAYCIRRDRPRPGDKWHIDEVVITIGGRKLGLWRAIDADGDVLDILLRQAQRFLSAHDQINTIFRPRRYTLTAISYRHARADAFSLWADYTAEMTA